MPLSAKHILLLLKDQRTLAVYKPKSNLLLYGIIAAIKGSNAPAPQNPS